MDRLQRTGAPVPLTTASLDEVARDVAMAYGSHASTREHSAFIREEMAASMALMGVNRIAELHPGLVDMGNR